MLSLGIEFSTQSVKTALLDALSGDVVHTGSFAYDERFPWYQTTGGVLPHNDPSVRQTSPSMLLEALDLCFALLLEQGVELGRVTVIKIDAMQHCTVCAGEDFQSAVGSLDPSRSIKEQIAPVLTRRNAPIWEDRSTAAEAALLEEAMSAHGGLYSLCGNRTELRFPAAQVLKWAREAPGEYRDTAHIFLLSAFLSSILAGRVCPVDTGDGWGTNFNSLDIQRPGWSDEILFEYDGLLEDAGLHGTIRKKIGGMTQYDTPLGVISPYFVVKYGMDPDAVVLAGTGDNPALLLGCGGHAVVSLGSSFTVNGIVSEITPSPSGGYNLFGYIPGTAMALTVITNGSKVHDEFIKRYIISSERHAPSNGDWERYIEAAGTPLLGAGEPLMLPYLFDESVPLRPRGMVREGFDDKDLSVNIRALHLSQALALKLHSGHLARLPSLCIAGGAARNRFMRQLIADVFGAETYTTADVVYAAPLGCAVSGARHLLGMSYDDAVERFVRRDSASVCRPLQENRETVRVLLERYTELEKKA